jgi:starch phosphorylase
MAQERDPVCGMAVDTDHVESVVFGEKTFWFCSPVCRRLFSSEPEKHARKVVFQEDGLLEATRRIAYFSMEVGVDSRMPTYSGGLGVLAGDTLKACADLKIPIVAVSLLYWKGYFNQTLDEQGNQYEQLAIWNPAEFARPLQARMQVAIEGRSVKIAAWQYDIIGVTGYAVPLFLLDTNLEENIPTDREWTAWLYGGDQRYRLAQEIILGVGGIRMLRALGYTSLERFHLNEGHAALLTIELLRETAKGEPAQWDFNAVRSRCVFTTHTPVPAGHDRFPYALVKSEWGESLPLEQLQMLGGKEFLNMTQLALNMSHYINGVAKKHGEVSHGMFPGYPIDSITNGVHSPTWTCDSFKKLYDRYIPGWISDPFSLRHAISIPSKEVWAAHEEAKQSLLEEVNKRTQVSLRPDLLTIGFARRAAEYKRADLIFSDPDQLLRIAETVGPLQFLFAGKAHPQDSGGKDVIRKIWGMAERLKDHITIIYLANYDMALARLLTSGVDLWLNTPLPPLEASGTSGMKAALNGVPSLSVLDGWWIEGHIEGMTGWAIGPGAGDLSRQGEVNRQHAQDLYEKLRKVIVPLFYSDREKWSDIMRHTISFNASFFNTHRMVQQYAANAYV